jgi:penicillin-binding protein 1A
VDENGMPLPPADEGAEGAVGPAPGDTSGVEAPQRIDQRWIDAVLGRTERPARPAQPAPARPATQPARPAQQPPQNGQRQPQQQRDSQSILPPGMQQSPQ